MMGASGRSKPTERSLRGYPRATCRTQQSPHEPRCTLCRPAHAKSDSLERPLHSLPRHRKYLISLARVLLDSDYTVDSHVRVLRAAFDPKPSPEALRALAARTFSWTSTRPQPRLKALVRQLVSEPLLHRILKRKRHVLRQLPVGTSSARMRPLPSAAPQVQLETVRDLADWLRLDPEHLLWFADLRDRIGAGNIPLLNHYNVHVTAKAYGAIRLVEAPKQLLKKFQRQILREILMPVPLDPAVHGFCKGRSILSFASPHAGREAVLRLDLQDFFPSISGARVQALFRTLGYPEPVADLLGGLCTTTAPRHVWRNAGCEITAAERQRARALYARPHLPQGAPTSPAIANLCAFRLDRRISGLAKAADIAYTRYADDLAFSGGAQFARMAERFTRQVAAIVSAEGFSLHHRKTRLMRSSVRQHLAGLTLNVCPNVPRRELERLEAILTNCVRHGPDTQNRDQHPDFRRHLEGKVAFATMIHPARAARIRLLLDQISWPLS